MFNYKGLQQWHTDSIFVFRDVFSLNGFSDKCDSQKAHDEWNALITNSVQNQKLKGKKTKTEKTRTFTKFLEFLSIHIWFSRPLEYTVVLYSWSFSYTAINILVRSNERSLVEHLFESAMDSLILRIVMMMMMMMMVRMIYIHM